MLDLAVLAAMAAAGAVAVPAVARQKIAGRQDFREVLCRTGVRWASEDERTAIGLKLAQAGVEEKPEWFAGLRVLLPAGFAVLCVPLLILGLDLFWAVFLVPLLYFAPNVWLSRKIEARKSAVRLSLPDFSVLLSTALAAGADAATALREAAEGAGGPLKKEIGRALREHDLGRALTDALTDMAERVDVNELRALVRTIVQAYRYGTPLAEAMRAHAEQMRTVRRFEIMEAAGKLTTKLIVPVMIFMLLPCMMSIFYPAAVHLVKAFE
ncbi:MAG: type II secretion system F family protein [Desulfotomaculales bacterium]